MLSRYRRGSKRTRVTKGIAAILLTSSGIPTLVHAGETASPIEHVVVIVGENWTFDSLFATYVPRPGQHVWNLLSRGIITAEGIPGPHFGLAKQYQGVLKAPSKFSLTPTSKTPYTTLPPPNTDGTPSVASDTNPAPFATLKAATLFEGQSLPAVDLPLLTSGASGLPNHVIYTRILNVNNLPNGPFQLTPGISYDDYSGSPVHRFYQMFQQLDCAAAQATPENPSGCLADLFPWVEVSIGAGNNGKPQPPGFNDETTGEGAISMGFFNVQLGYVPYFTELGNKYAMSDNYHQPVKGGTGADSIPPGAADNYYYTDGHGHAMPPPANQIENPDPQPGTNNWYTQDGYGGGTYSNCSDAKQPGVGAILDYLAACPANPSRTARQGIIIS